MVALYPHPSASADVVAQSVRLTDDPRVVEKAVTAFLARNEPVMFDVETTGLDPRANKLVMVQLRQPSSKSTLVIDWRGFYDWDRSEDRARVRLLLNELFNKRMAVGHNIKFDSQFMRQQSVELPKVFDTMIAEQLLLGQGYGKGEGLHLKDTLSRRLGVEIDKLAREWFYQPAPLDDASREAEWRAAFPREEIDYAAKDVDLLVPLFEAQRALLAEEGLREVAHIEMRALPAIALMELRGIKVNIVGWRAFIAEKAVEAKKLEAEAVKTFGPPILDARIRRYDEALDYWQQARDALKAYEAELRDEYDYISKDGPMDGWGAFKKERVAKYRAEHPIPSKPKCDTSLPNIGSTHQMIDAMEGLGIPVPTKRNEKGEIKKTTDSDSLERLAPEHPALKTVLNYREAEKFVDSFGEKLLSFADKNDRIHPDYRQIGADTGRMSCTKPNWQQVPSKGDGARLRENVVASPGHVLITADLSNFELRTLADLSGDEQMLSMFASGEDLHSYTAKLMFKLPMDWDKKRCDAEEWRNGLSYRKAAKIVNYLIPYGGSAFAIAQQNNIPKSEAEELLNGWFGMFSQAGKYLEAQAKLTRRTLVSRTASGRIRRFNPPGPEPQRRIRPYDPLDKIPAGFVKSTTAKVLVEDFESFNTRMRDWKKAWGAIERAGRNNPMQGLNADVIKLAAAMFYERCDYRLGIIVAIVHDELVVEARESSALVVKEILADAMEQAPRKYLKRVTIPRPEPTISQTWEHD